MNYGIKKTTQTGSTLLLTQDGFMSARFVGLDGVAAKEWKTRAGAERNASRNRSEYFPKGTVEVFTITDIMNY